YERELQALKERGLWDLFSKFVLRFIGPVQEMSETGLLVDEATLQALREKLLGERDNYMRIIEQETLTLLGRTINPRSSAQVKQALKELGLKIPTKTNKKTGEAGETTDKKALVKLKKRYPKEP